MKKALNPISKGLVLFGAINWGMIGVARFDAVSWMFGKRFGRTSFWTRVLYAAVGAAGGYRIYDMISAPRSLERAPGHMTREVRSA
jgi:uncharacterized membrane protein YuzA (DUF378 family)